MNNDIDQMHFLVLHIGEARCKSNWNYKQVCSPFTRIYYVPHGHAQIEISGKTMDLRPGHLYIIPPFTLHNNICKEEFHHFYIHIYNESAHDILEDWNLPFEIQATDRTAYDIKRLYELCPGMELQEYEPCSYDNRTNLSKNILKNKQRNLAVRVESRGLIYQLMSGFLHTAQPKQYIKDERITKVLGYIRTHLGEKPNIENLADLSCLSKDHLIRIFKREMNTTPLNYINKKKIEKAQLRLVTETATIKEIAYQLGFDDPAYFNRIFKKTTGITPMEYRKKNQISSL